MNLSNHFTLEELTYTDHREFDNTPGPVEVENLKRVAALLEQVRAVVGAPILVTSGYRNLMVNAAVGSKPTSQHRIGCAADFRVPGVTPDQVVCAVRAAGLAYDQLIREFDRWTHISVPSLTTALPRRQALIIDATGTRAYV